MDAILFLLFAAIAVVCAINLVVQTHPISSALSLIGVMGSLAVLYLLLGAEFIAMVQLIVYAGAIMVLFVFVIMLLNAGSEARPRRFQYSRLAGIPLLAIFLGVVSYVIQRSVPATQVVQFQPFSNVHDLGRKLFIDYLLPFELTSVLILIAILGAIVLARKEI
jgi:NADH-quinone oxidoreductase subunit J